MEVLITGGNGLLGRHLVAALIDRGDRVRVLALPAEDVSWLEDRGVAVYRGDVCDPGTLTEPMRGADGVLHVAGMLGVWRPMSDYHAVNVTGTENVCRGALAAGVGRLVHVSSWTVYGMGLGRPPVPETAPLAPLAEPCSVTKAAGDLLVQRLIAEDRLPAVIVRPGTFFGPGDRLHFGRMADRVRSGRNVVIGRGNNALAFVYISDVVTGVLLALDNERALGEVYNLTNDEPLTQRQILDVIAREIGVQPRHVHVPYAPLYAAGAAFERVAYMTRARSKPVVTRLGVTLFGSDNRHSIDKARSELGFEPRVSVEEGIRLAAAWYSKDTAGPLALARRTEEVGV